MQAKGVMLRIKFVAYGKNELAMNIPQEVNDFLSTENKALVAEIEKMVPVNFTLCEDAGQYQSKSKKNGGKIVSAEIYYKYPLEQAKFSHELLHMKVDLILGDCYFLYWLSCEDEMLAKVVDENFCADFLNVTQHVIFYPDILDMGYSIEEQFEMPRDEAKIEVIYQDALKSRLKYKGVYDGQRIKCYVQLLVMYMFYPDEKRFAHRVKALKRICAPLYALVKNLRDTLDDIAIDASNREIVQDAYMEFATKLRHQIYRMYNTPEPKLILE